MARKKDKESEIRETLARMQMELERLKRDGPNLGRGKLAYKASRVDKEPPKGAVAGLDQESMRATFVMSRDAVRAIEIIAWYERTQKKQVINTMVDDYIKKNYGSYKEIWKMWEGKE